MKQLEFCGNNHVKIRHHPIETTIHRLMFLFRSLIIVITAYKNIHMHIHIFWVKHPTLTGHLSCRKLAYGQIKGRPFPLGKEFDAEIGRRKTGQVEDHPTASLKKNVGIFLKYFQNQFVTLFPKFTPEKQLPVFC